MNTLEMLKNVNKGMKYRLGSWHFDKTARIQRSEIGDVPVVVADGSFNEPFQVLRFLDETDWVEYIETIKYSTLKFGEEFVKIGYEGVYVKLNPVYMGEYGVDKLNVYFNKSTHIIHYSGAKDFDVQRVK